MIITQLSKGGIKKLNDFHDIFWPNQLYIDRDEEQGEFVIFYNIVVTAITTKSKKPIIELL
jgi:hypothetical protein